MSLATVSLAVPLATDADGVIRVGGTRVTLDIVIFAYKEGAIAEDIVDQYPSLKLADVHAVISYYLQNLAEVEAYLSGREKERERIRQMIEERFDQKGIRERLLARERAKAS